MSKHPYVFGRKIREENCMSQCDFEKKKKCKNSLKKHIFVYFVKKKTTLVTVFLMK